MRKCLFLAGALVALAARIAPAGAEDERWVVVYSEKPAIAEFRDYGLVVLDSIHHPPIRPLLEQRKTVIGYISLGEVENYRDYYKEVEKEGILYEKNPNWPDSRWAFCSFTVRRSSSGTTCESMARATLKSSVAILILLAASAPD